MKQENLIQHSSQRNKKINFQDITGSSSKKSIYDKKIIYKTYKLRDPSTLSINVKKDDEVINKNGKIFL